jgi:hypothetical protein
VAIMDREVIILIFSIVLYLIILFLNEKKDKFKKSMWIINISFGLLLIPYCLSSVTGIELKNNIVNLTDTKKDLSRKISLQIALINDIRKENTELNNKLDRQEILTGDISKMIVAALEGECLKDLNERRENIKKLHKQTFQISKVEYDTFVDELFDDIEKIQSKQKQLESEQIKQSDQSLVYFESLLMYVLQKFDTISDQLDERGELDKTIKYEDNLREYIYGKNSHYLVIRDYILTNKINITITIANRSFENDKLKRHPLIKIDAKDRPFRREMHHLFFHIKGPKVKKLMPKGGTTGVIYTPLQHITYPLGEDPLLNKNVKKQIDTQIRKMFQIIYLPKD